MFQDSATSFRFPDLWAWNRPEAEHFVNTRVLPALKALEESESSGLILELPGATLLWLETEGRLEVISRLAALCRAGRLELLGSIFSIEPQSLTADEFLDEAETFSRWCAFRGLKLAEQKFAAPTKSITLSFPIPQALLTSRAALLGRIKLFRERRTEAFGGLFREDRLLKAEGWYYLSRPIRALQDPYVRRKLFRALISAQVELDMLERPEVDPNDGWIEFEERSTAGEFGVRSQLFEAFFSESQGGMLSFEEKPRKTNLLSVLAPETRPAFLDFYVELDGEAERLTEDQLASFLPPPQSVFSEACEWRVLKQIASAVSLRLEREFMLSKGNLLSNFIFNFKAGIGAHLQNSTTGFAVEYWVDAVDKPQALMGLQLPLMLPSAAVEGMSAIALQCVGGVSTLRRSLEHPFLLSSQLVPGGLYGLRLIDGVDGYVIDFRSAKGLLAIYHHPIYDTPPHPDEPGQYQGSLFYFLSAAHRIYGEDKANTLFVSVL